MMDQMPVEGLLADARRGDFTCCSECGSLFGGHDCHAMTGEVERR
jgi:hypothetical protein